MIGWALLVLAIICLVAAVLYGRRRPRIAVMWRRVVVVWGIIVATLLIAILPATVAGRSTVVSNRDIVIVADLTQSMNALDGRDGGETTRIDDMRKDIKQLADSQAGASIGIMTFADRTDLYLPLTTGSGDIHSAADTLFTASSNQSISKIASYLDVFGKVGEYLVEQNNTDPTRERVVVFMSDFEIFKQQEPEGDIVAGVRKISEQGAGFVAVSYGSTNPVKMLKMQFNYLTGLFEPAYKVYGGTDESSRYYQDNYKTVFSAANPELATKIADNIGGRSIDATKSQDFQQSIEQGASKSLSAKSASSELQASNQQLFYVIPAAVGFGWLIVMEVIKPDWAMRRLSPRSHKSPRSGKDTQP
jgi:hypothetical protein